MDKKGYIQTLCSTEQGRKILVNKIEKILEDEDLYDFDCMDEITNALMKSEKGREKIKQNFKSITNLFDRDEYNDAGSNNPKDIKYWTFILKLMQEETDYEFVTNNLDMIISQMSELETVDFIEKLRPETQAKVKNENEFIYDMYRKGIFFKDTLGLTLKNGLSPFFEVLFDELSEGKEIKTLGEGAFSQVFKTNGYIVKIGKQRETYEIPYHPNLLQPLMKNRGIDEKGNYRYVVEVQNECDVENVTEEQAEELKEKLKKVGIIWNDIGSQNIGITLKPNRRTLNIGTLENPDDFNGSYTVGILDEETPENTVVMTDVDFIKYSQNDIRKEDEER